MLFQGEVGLPMYDLVIFLLCYFFITTVLLGIICFSRAGAGLRRHRQLTCTRGSRILFRSDI